MAQILQAGPISVCYQAGFLRYLTIDGVEVLRMIYFAIRDHLWQTAKLTITDEVIKYTADSFQVRYQWHTNDLGVQMTGRMEITGAADGTISVDYYGKALNQFTRNRVGLCVLHPLNGVTGQPCEVEGSDGQRTKGRFPEYISPYQPFLNIQTLRWQSASGYPMQLTFAGDVFEMEDQRNWTDASFKTYSTPLVLPFPVVVTPGDVVQQRIVFSLVPAQLMDQAMIGPTLQLGYEESMETFEQTSYINKPPRIGLGQRADGQPLTKQEASRLRELTLSHLRADVMLTTTDWKPRLTNALADARALHVPLELALFLGSNPRQDLSALLTFLTKQPVDIRSVLLFESVTLLTSDKLLGQLVVPIRAVWPNALIGGGTDGFFADFNRNPFDYNQVDFVTYTVTPQVHAFDDLTLLENIAGQPPTVQTARHLTGGKPVHISPITLLPRYTTVAGSAIERLSPPTDPRQATNFAADWTRRSLTVLTSTGVDSVTYFETHGPRGLVDGELVFPVFETVKHASSI